MASENDTSDRERRVAHLLRVAAETERAPQSLHARVTALKAPAAPRRRRPRLRRPAWIALPTAAAIVAALVVALGGGAGAPSLAQAAALGTRPATAPAPTTDPRDPAKLLSARVGTLHFPNWQAAGGWQPTGRRVDHIGNRSATTVYYATGSSHVAYSIVSAPALPGLKTGGEPYATMWSHGRVTVIWEESGHTCLLSGAGISAARLWQLASFGFRRAL